MQQPLISIILPTYNGAKFIRTSVDSCLQQSYTNFELIIVNDNSADDTPAIIEDYAKKDPRIKVIHNSINKRLPQSLNIGFGAATGDYFTWTSDDNYYTPNALQTMMDTLKENESIDLVYADYTLIDDDGKIFGVRQFKDVYANFTSWLGCGACFLYKAVIHKALNGYDPSAYLIEDYEFFVRAFLQYQFKYLPTAELYFYRDHPASLTSTQKSSVNDLSKIVIERLIPKLAQKLPSNQMALLYRKFAVYYAVLKNNTSKSSYYLQKLTGLSKKQALVSIIYIIAMKFYWAFRFLVFGFTEFFRLLIGKK